MRLDENPRLPSGAGLATRLYELFRNIAKANNKRADGFTCAGVSVTAAYTMQTGESVVFANAAGGAFTVTLPAAADAQGKFIAVRKTEGGANNVTLDPAVGNINGAATLALTAAAPSALVVSDGSNYFTV